MNKRLIFSFVIATALILLTPVVMARQVNAWVMQPLSINACDPVIEPNEVSSYSTTGHDGNLPSNVFDKNLNTRWSDESDLSWMHIKLDKPKLLCSIDIAFYRGDERINPFRVYVSHNSSIWYQSYEGVTSGTTEGFQHFVFTKKHYEMQYILLHFEEAIYHDSDTTSWTSLLEVEFNKPNPDRYLADSIANPSVTPLGTVYAVAVPPTLPTPAIIPVPPTDPDHEPDNEQEQQTTESTPTEPVQTTSIPLPPVSSETDVFGLKKIYPSAQGAEQWSLGSNANDDNRFDPKSTVTKNSDGSWKLKSSQVRMNVFTSTGYDPDDISTYNQGQLATKGYMQSSNDWKNVEMTGFVKVNSASNDNFAWYARGGKHNDSNGGCEGTGYKIDLYYNGDVRFAKEQQHADGYSFTSTEDATNSIMGRWVGLKGIMYNNAQGNVVLENWMSEDGGSTWNRVDTHIDSGNWGSDGDMCGGSPGQKISWGGPIATFRWDSASDVDFKWLSVREIIPPT